MSCLLVAEMNSLWVSGFAHISSHSGLLLSFLKVSFAGHLLLNWSRSCFPIFSVFFIALWDGLKKTLQFLSLHVLPMFSLRLSQNLSWTLDLYYLKLISCVVLEKYSNLILIFFILISLALPSQCLLPVYILGIRGGTFPFLHTFISIDCWVSDNAIQPSVRWYLPGVSICISNIWWHWPLFRWFVFKGDSSSPLKIGFW